MEKINFEEGTLVTPAKVIIDNVEYEVTPAVYSGNTPLSPFVLNKLQDNIDVHKYRLTITETIAANTNITIPCSYKVGTNCMDVYYLGERLIKTEGTNEGNYKEIGEDGSISNVIQLDGWAIGDIDGVVEYLEFVVRGDYSES